MTVKTRSDAWVLVSRLFQEDLKLAPDSERTAGYKIYRSAQEKSDARICDLNDRLEVTYQDGMTENIWIEDLIEHDTIAVVGLYVEKTVFGEVKVREIKEVTYHYVQGMVNKTLDDGRFGVELTLPNGDTATFGCENVAYIRFE